VIMKKLVFIIIVLLLAGCSSLPTAISPEQLEIIPPQDDEATIIPPENISPEITRNVTEIPEMSGDSPVSPDISEVEVIMRHTDITAGQVVKVRSNSTEKLLRGKVGLVERPPYITATGWKVNVNITGLGHRVLTPSDLEPHKIVP